MIDIRRVKLALNPRNSTIEFDIKEVVMEK